MYTIHDTKPCRCVSQLHDNRLYINQLSMAHSFAPLKPTTATRFHTFCVWNSFVLFLSKVPLRSFGRLNKSITYCRETSVPISRDHLCEPPTRKIAKSVTFVINVFFHHTICVGYRRLTRFVVWLTYVSVSAGKLRFRRGQNGVQNSVAYLRLCQTGII